MTRTIAAACLAVALAVGCARGSGDDTPAACEGDIEPGSAMWDYCRRQDRPLYAP